jgi:hypothetical protein
LGQPSWVPYLFSEPPVSSAAGESYHTVFESLLSFQREIIYEEKRR